MRYQWFILVLLLAALVTAGSIRSGVSAAPPANRWQVHEPIVHSNLALFPVTSTGSRPSGDYITLDEGLRTGEVEVTELGGALVRRRPGAPRPDRAQVNSLALVNHSKKALILLAGEIVTGGKQDRVIAQDRIVPPGADPLPLDVFCVEPGRWAGASLAFERSGLMAAPKVREKAAVAKNQQEVWDATEETRQGVARSAVVVGAAAAELNTSTSYQLLESSDAFKRTIDEASTELQREYEQALRGALRGKDVVGVVVAINGEVVWADLFGDADLFQRYWVKLLRSYTVEALSGPVREHARASVVDAERFLAEQEGKQIIEVEPGTYRLLRIDHPRYSVFQLASLWEKGEPLLHFNKLRKEGGRRPDPIRPLHRRR